MKPPEKALVCARADDKWVVPGSAFDRYCADCGTRIMIAPSGVRRLASDPEIVPLCIPCAAAHRATMCEEPELEIAASPEELETELRTTQPNFWRKRN